VLSAVRGWGGVRCALLLAFLMLPSHWNFQCFHEYNHAVSGDRIKGLTTATVVPSPTELYERLGVR